MPFTLIPSDHVPLCGGAIYAFESDLAADRTFRITDSETRDLLGIKRFYAARSGRFDIAPYLRDRFRFLPGSGPTGFADAAGRSVSVIVETDDAAAPPRTFLAGTRACDASPLRTALPPVRLLSGDECDEITLLAPQSCTATLEIRRGGTTEVLTYPQSGPGLRLFRLDAADFPGAEAFTLAFAGAEAIEYRIVERPAEAVRLAWIGSTGSIEHYTFPVEQECTVRTDHTSACGTDGLRTGTRNAVRHTVLRSAFETSAMTDALTELLVAPRVWVARRDGTHAPADLRTETATVRRHGMLCCLEITICTPPQTRIR